jgi:hypothetical protein
MSIDLDAKGQMCLLRRCDRQTVITLAQGHHLLVLYEAIPWHDLIEKAKPILYDEQGISPNLGRELNLRAHLGAYLMQTVHGWTDRWTEEMIRYYVPARVFCGFLESTGSLDHTRIEAFRNRFGKKGAQLITQDMLKVAQEYGFCGPEDVDMDTTVQEAGITYPTEMKLLDHLMKKAQRFHAKLKKAGKRGIRGIKRGYVLVDAPVKVKIADQHCVKESLRIHHEVFSEPPESYATDRGMYSEANINRCRRAGVVKIGIQPKGQAKPIVSRRDHRRLKNRRAGIEPRLGHLKTRGLGRSRMKTDEGDIISGHRSALGYNLCHLVRDLKRQSVGRMVAN